MSCPTKKVFLIFAYFLLFDILVQFYHTFAQSENPVQERGIGAKDVILFPCHHQIIK
jgi:hypothetical protein